MRVKDFEQQASIELTQAGVDSPRISVQMLLETVLGLDRLALFLNADRLLTLPELELLLSLLERRKHGEPMAYLTGHKEFYGINFLVSPATLIPRPETELLVELVFSKYGQETEKIFLDAGAGCGNIAITLCLHRSAWQGFLLELAPDALSIARQNIFRHGLEMRLEALQADCKVIPLATSSLDFIVANPPYIGLEESNRVMPSVLQFEPHQALFSADAGLAHLQSLIVQSCRLLRPGGWIFLEHGEQQGKAVRAAFVQTGYFGVVKTVQDLAGKERCTMAQKNL